jgi:hypothetical protein
LKINYLRVEKCDYDGPDYDGPDFDGPGFTMEPPVTVLNYVNKGVGASSVFGAPVASKATKKELN